MEESNIKKILNFKFQISIFERGHALRSTFTTKGFTLIEVMIVMGVVGLLMGYMSLNVLNSRNSANINTALTTFITDFKNQQTKAMVGDTEGRGVPDTYSIYFNSDKYVLFHGATYVATDSSNFSVTMPQGLTITTTFPSSKIIFSQGSGEISPFTPGSNTVVITNSSTGQQKIIQINKYGIITAN